MDTPLPPTLMPLATLLEHCIADRDAALARQARAQEQARQLLAQQQHLSDWRQAYRERWLTQFRQSGQIEIVQSYQTFLSRLEQALAHLQVRLEQAELEIDQARLELLSCERRAASVRKLLERRLQEQHQQVMKRQQRDSDEQAAAMHRRLSAALSIGTAP